MAATDKDRADNVEYPRGEIEIISPGEDARRSPFEAQGASAQRTYAFQTRLSGFLGFVFAAVVASALFVMVAGFLAVAITVAVAVVAGFILRNKIRQWLGR